MKEAHLNLLSPTYLPKNHLNTSRKRMPPPRCSCTIVVLGKHPGKLYQTRLIKETYRKQKEQIGVSRKYSKHNNCALKYP